MLTSVIKDGSGENEMLQCDREAGRGDGGRRGGGRVRLVVGGWFVLGRQSLACD